MSIDVELSKETQDYAIIRGRGFPRPLCHGIAVPHSFERLAVRVSAL